MEAPFPVMKKLLPFAISASIMSTPPVVQANEVVEPVVDGMRLELGDYVQEVEVRVQSLGPGFCGTVFTLAGKETQYLAPPLTWSEWIKLEPFSFGKSTLTLGMRTICDTGSIAEVKYSK